MQKCKILEQLDTITCQNQHKNQPIIIVLVDQELKGNQRLMCQECLLNNRGVLNGVSFNDFMDKIQEVKQSVCYEITKSVEIYSDQLDGLINDFRQIKSETIQIIDQMMNLISMWKNELHGLSIDSMRFSIMEEINNVNLSHQQLIDQEKNQYEEKIKKLNNNYTIKTLMNVESLRKILCENVKEKLQAVIEQSSNQRNWNLEILNKEIKEKNNELEKKKQQLLQEQAKQQSVFFNQVFTDQDSQLFMGGEFNKDNSLFVTEYFTQIFVWKFENGKLIDQNLKFKLGQGVEQTVFSKKNNWFVFGMEQGSIKCCIEREKKSWFNSHNWEISKSHKKHTKRIISLILNNQEDLLISSSEDQTINIWGVDQIKNSLTFIYSLDTPISCVFQITLSLNETNLVSRSDKLILWALDKNNKWAVQTLHAKQIDIQGPTCFITDEILVAGEQQKSQITIFKIEKGSFQELHNIEIEIIDKLNQNMHSKIFYNGDKQVMIVQFGQKIFILKQLQNWKFYVEQNLSLEISNKIVISKDYKYMYHFRSLYEIIYK
ncbi:unnamed protein product [Paramecium sonneborni]|uniref:WD40-repeat-containing domain n=1 Tax=Paramecium sonneborni TaxID=65129 RepID=A0A8S1RQQ0_9CILI|nr:unnamed protein product [Paramecium sonneborni]